MTDNFSDIPTIHSDPMHAGALDHLVRQLRRGAEFLAESLVLPMSTNLWEEIRGALTAVQPDWLQVRRGGHHLYGHQLHVPSAYAPDSHKTYAISNPPSHHPMERDQWVLCSLCGQPIKATVSDTTVELLVQCPEPLQEVDGTGWVARTLPLPTRPKGVFL